MTDWQPIETAPEWELVWVYQKESAKTKSCQDGVFSAVNIGGGVWSLSGMHGKRDFQTGFLVPPPTHWHSRPEPPESNK